MRGAGSSLLERARGVYMQLREPLFRAVVILVGVLSFSNLAWMAARENNPRQAYVINPNRSEPVAYLGDERSVSGCESQAIRYRMDELIADRSIVGIEDLCVRRCWPIERGRVTVFDRDCTVQVDPYGHGANAQVD